MATTQEADDGTPAGTFTINTREHGYPDGPDHVHVEINAGGRNDGMAILAAGVDGRYSFDFRVSVSQIELTKAYVEGMREPVDALPDWVTPIRKKIERELGLVA